MASYQSNKYSEPPLSQCPEPIAVVGMGCRLPGNVYSPSQFWDLMANERSGQSNEVPKTRFNMKAHLHPNNDRPGSFNVPGGYFLDDDIRNFDPSMFGISPVEASWMDPQQRKMLEVVYETFESAGLTMKDVSGRQIGCYMATFTADHQLSSMREPEFRHSYAATGVDPGILSARIGHVFNLLGPAFVINTACSSSVYALHNAISALRHGEIEAAIVGGSNLILTVDQHMNTAKLGVLSPTSTCHTFDASADGYGRAEGVGALYIKRLSDAIRNGDPIRAVIRGTATNTNGKPSQGLGITFPSREGQIRVIRSAYKHAGGLNPLLCGYFECHGTGTPVGDPIEVEAVSRAMTGNRSEDDPLLIGAVKTNIGHSEAASGIAAVIKAVMVVEKGIIPPVKGFKTPNPAIRFEEWKVKVVDKVSPWPANLRIRRASVNSFGYGGSNAHVIVEAVDSVLMQYTPSIPLQLSEFNTQRTRFLLPFAAHDRATAKRNISKYQEYSKKDRSIVDIAYTLSARRSLLKSRAFTVSTQQTTAEKLAEDVIQVGDIKGGDRKLAFVFTGQGAQWPRMGVELLQEFPSVKKTIEKLDKVLRNIDDGPEWTIESALLADAATSKIHEVQQSQPLCTAIQVAIVDLLRSWNITPVATVGHSSGEIGAAYAAGYLSAEEAILVSYYRGKAVSEPGQNGAMIAVGLGADDAKAFLEDLKGKVVIACQNSSESVTLSGDADAVSSVGAKLQEAKIFNRTLKTGGRAYHSHHMQDYAAKYESAMSAAYTKLSIKPQVSPKALMVSSVTGEPLDGEELGPSYWVRNMTHPVLFNIALGKLLSHSEESINGIIEIGPHSALAGPVRKILSDNSATDVSYDGSALLRGADDVEQILKLVGKLFLDGYPVDLQQVNSIEVLGKNGKIEVKSGTLLTDLPTYQWNYPKMLWGESRWSAESRNLTHGRHDLLGSRLSGGTKNEPTWRNILRLRDLPWLADHHLGLENIFPASAYWCMAIEALQQINEISGNDIPMSSFTLRDVSIKEALVIPESDDGVEVLFSSRMDGQWMEFRISSFNEGTWLDHTSGRIALNLHAGSSPIRTPSIPLPQRYSGKRWYESFNDIGFRYTGCFRGIDDIRTNANFAEAVAATTLRQKSGVVHGESRYVLHPATLDACLHAVLIAIVYGQTRNMKHGFVPVHADEIIIRAPTNFEEMEIGSTYGWLEHEGARRRSAGLQLTTKENESLFEISGLKLISFEAALPQGFDFNSATENYWHAEWKPDIDAMDAAQVESYFRSRCDADSVWPTLSQLYAFKNPRLNVLDLTMEEENDDTSLQQRLEEAATASLVNLVLYPGQITPSVFEKIRPLVAVDGTIIFHATQNDDADCWHDFGFETRFKITRNQEPVIVAVTASPLPGLADVSDSGFEDNSDVYFVHIKEQPDITKNLFKAATHLGLVPISLSLQEAVQSSSVGRRYVLLDLGKPLLTSLDDELFTSIKALLSSGSVVWVTNGGLMNGKRPEFSLPTGVARSIRSEQVSLKLTVIDVDLDEEPLDSAAKAIISCFSQQCEGCPDTEFRLWQGVPYINRLQPQGNTPTSTENSAKRFDTPELVRRDLKTIVVFPQQSQTVKELNDWDIEVEVSAVGVDPDLFGSDSKTFSHEFSGTVSRLGNAVTSVTVGQSVMGLTPRGGSMTQLVSADFVHPYEPTRVGCYTEAASVPVAYTTAYHVLNHIARISSGESLLVLPGAGTTGFALIATGVLLGASVYTVATSPEEAKYLAKQSRLPLTHILVAGDGSFKTQIESATNSTGFDVIVGSSKDAGGDEAWRSIAAFGRFIELRSKTPAPASSFILDKNPFTRNANYVSFDLVQTLEHKPALLKPSFAAAMALVQQGKLRLLGPLSIHSLGDLPDFKSPATSVLSARVVVDYTTGLDALEIEPRTAHSLFDPNASYLLAGCLGGLGRSLSTWMIDNGAKHLIFVGRSAADSPAAAALIRSIQHRGITSTVIRGDITKVSDVEHIRASLPGPPLRGIIQAAMVLEDGMFETMTLSGFNRAVQPKVAGTYNLHKAFSDTPLDFFIMTSSISATLGTPGQANYSAGNNYLDAIAIHRRALGLPAVSLILPMVIGVGYVAEHPEIEEALTRKGLYGIEEAELLEAFKAAVLSGTSSPEQIVVGLEPSRLVNALGRNQTTDAFWLHTASLTHISAAIERAQHGAGGKAHDDSDIRARVSMAASSAEAVDHVCAHIADKLARLLLIPEDTISRGKTVGFYGLDSMIGAEFRNWVFKQFGVDMSMQHLLSAGLSIEMLAQELCAGLGVSFS